MYLQTVCVHSGRPKKVLWWLTATCLLVILVYNVVSISREYFERPVDVIRTLHQETQLVFPAVTICNICPVKRSSFMEFLHSREDPAKRGRRSARAGRPRGKTDDTSITGRAQTVVKNEGADVLFSTESLVSELSDELGDQWSVWVSETQNKHTLHDNVGWRRRRGKRSACK